jgi:dethiobiotin synthase
MTPIRIAFAGTGTEVGKTTLARRAAAGLRRHGRRVLALKPLETGFIDPTQSDAGRLATSAGHPLVAPHFTAAAPVAPMRAALDQGWQLDLQAVGAWVAHNEALATPEFTLIETAGGLFTPLAQSITNLELVQSLGITAWLLVARDRLGVLHDCLVTLAAVRERGCLPRAIVFGARDPAPPASNLEDLRLCCEVPVYRDPSEDELVRLIVAHVTVTG